MRVQNKDLSVSWISVVRKWLTREAFFTFCYGTSAWLAIQSTILILAPKLVINLVTVDESHHSSGLSYSFQPCRTKSSDVELYLARSLGLALTAISLMCLFFTGAVPIPTSSEPIRLEDNDATAPYAGAVLLVVSSFHLVSTIYCYTRYANTAQSGYLLGTIGYGALAALGGWCTMFGFTARVSARTGEDKRTSGFLFPNASAYDKKADKKVK